MGKLDNHIHNRKDPSYGKILTPSPKEDEQQKRGKKRALSLLATFLQKLIHHILPDTQLCTEKNAQVLSHITAFRKLLATLAGEDYSHNPNFNRQLFELWHNLLDDCNSLPPTQAHSKEILNKLKFLTSQIEHFPLGAEHTLGTHLSCRSSKDSLPDPCMNLLQDLHKEFVDGPYRSTLHNWIVLLDDILLSRKSQD